MSQQLALFDLPPGPAPRAGDRQPVMAPAQAGHAPMAGKTRASPTAPATTAPASLLAPVEFRHPRASRELRLGDAVVAYALQRVRRRSIGFTVGPDGLSVRAPGWVTLGAVDAALREKADWILRKLSETRQRQQRLESARIVWADGALLPYLGEPLQLVLDPGHGFSDPGALLLACTGSGDAPRLQIALPHSATAAQIRDAVQAWLMRAARRHFSARLDHFAPLLGVRWSRLRLSSAQTRWGSAKADGSIRLNWRLLHYRPAIIDYVVAHELAHLRVMDHSPRFWDTVASVVPDYARLRGHLRDAPAPLWE
ncbi:M48 family peptidase [Verminephrobacter eiseniae]|uniref:M48 family metallopeptidase n=1 Tax=Verminephrobacter eiseniae TaxID=364317 RepID=UPI002A571BD7|nr:M48 family peptidase [Verminephrobacter eiseniae]